LVEWNEDNYGPLIIPKKGDKINLNTGNIEIWKTLINREMKNYSVTVEKGNVLVNGKIIKSYTIKNDYYFMVGDNRDDSYDSRHWGFLSRENIIGKPIVIFWSWDSNIPVTRPFDLFSSIRFKRIAKLVK
jgi:signal peptidase I